MHEHGFLVVCESCADDQASETSVLSETSAEEDGADRLSHLADDHPIFVCDHPADDRLEQQDVVRDIAEQEGHSDAVECDVCSLMISKSMNLQNALILQKCPYPQSMKNRV